MWRLEKANPNENNQNKTKTDRKTKIPAIEELSYNSIFSILHVSMIDILRAVDHKSQGHVQNIHIRWKKDKK